VSINILISNLIVGLVHLICSVDAQKPSWVISADQGDLTYVIQLIKVFLTLLVSHYTFSIFLSEMLRPQWPLNRIYSYLVTLVQIRLQFLCFLETSDVALSVGVSYDIVNRNFAGTTNNIIVPDWQRFYLFLTSLTLALTNMVKLMNNSLDLVSIGSNFTHRHGYGAHLRPTGSVRGVSLHFKCAFVSFSFFQIN
jgi:hypothetical protein